MIKKGAAAAVVASIVLAASGCASSSTSTTGSSSNPSPSGLNDQAPTTPDTPTDTTPDTSTTSSEVPGSYSHADDSGFCSSHQCIESFADGNGYVVQCMDEEWSHSGGRSGACSDHGGESATSSADAGATSPSQGSSSSGSSSSPPDNPLSNQCDSNVSTSTNVTCGLAENTFYEYYKASGGNPTQSETIQAWSPSTKQYYSEDCTVSRYAVDCAFANNDIRLSASGLSAYSQDQASPYAQSHDVGPNG